MVGDALEAPHPTRDGRVTSVVRYDATARVHNLTVGSVHTYYVVVGDVQVLVHNCGGDDLVDLYRAPQRGDGPDELANGLNPSRPVDGDGSAYLGTEDVAQEYAAHRVGTHEDGYIRFKVNRRDLAAITPRRKYQGGPGSEWAIPHSKIAEFNSKTVSRERIDMPW